MDAVLDFLAEVVGDGFLDTLRLVPFLFATYLLMEYIEHRSAGGAQRFVRRSGKLGPLVGGVVGMVPQCGFSAAAANFFAGRMITPGTLLAVFLSSSDEMLPVLIGGRVEPLTILIAVAGKAGIGIVVGFAADAILRLLHRDARQEQVEDLCEKEGCHCERGIFRSALYHTLTVGAFVLAITLCIGTAVYFLGAQRLGALFTAQPFLTHLLCTLTGMIPNCAASVALTQFYVDGLIPFGAMLGGLVAGSGTGLLVLLRMNRHPRENIAIVLTLFTVGLVSGSLWDWCGSTFFAG